ncbi:hypothetical protein C1646_778329 [Rhizophagus diaphanus]|nr:hypothetical protein C1646_778329 [Rhizophagus diaphanus] [Rhizophagus sp. MUCL 43196]
MSGVLLRVSEAQHIYHYNEVINQILHYIIEKKYEKNLNKKHFRDDLIDNEQKSLYNKKVRSSDNSNELYLKKGESSDNTITDDPSNKTSNDVKNDKDNSVNKDNNDNITNDLNNKTSNGTN